MFQLLKYISLIKTNLYICMVVIVKDILKMYAQRHPGSAKPLNKWYNIVKAANWGRLGELKEAFNNVDYIGNDRYVFNIKGNALRIVTMIFFDKRTVYIRFIGTHKEYDKINCSTI